MSFARYQAQAVLFAARPSRLGLQRLDLPAPDVRSVRVNVWRNHAIESIIALARPYLAYGLWDAEFDLSDYDDTLSFAGHRPADVELLWLDADRYLNLGSFGSLRVWLEDRLGRLRRMTNAPIVLAAWFADAARQRQVQALVDSVPAAYFADLGASCSEAGVTLLDQRSAAMAGSPVSNAAQPILARELACHWLPAAVFPPIKAVVVDLDNTLHAGVLAEDGTRGVTLTPAHRSFQDSIKSLGQRGIFVALASRNERADVEALFRQRSDYPLRWDDFSAIEISWDDKAAAVGRIAEALRIAPDAMLFVDDNPGELAGIAAALPHVRTIHADPDAALTQRAVDFYPGLWRWRIGEDDSKRIRDLRANAERKRLRASAADPDEYLESLQVTLAYRYDPLDQRARVADLLNKTTQFNLALRRCSEAEIAERLARPDACVASVQMKDRLSDSGVIAVIVAERVRDTLIVEDLCVSCRALGRQLEDTFILVAIRGMPQFAGAREVAFRLNHGPRNRLAIDWLARLLACAAPPGPGLHAVPAERLRDFVPVKGVALIVQ